MNFATLPTQKSLAFFLVALTSFGKPAPLFCFSFREPHCGHVPLTPAWVAGGQAQKAANACFYLPSALIFK